MAGYTKTTWVDEVLAGAERYDIKDNGGTPIYSNTQINLATGVTVAGTPVNAAAMNNVESGIDALMNGGWIAGGSWTYVSASSFNVSTDLTSIFTVGRIIKWTQTTVKYGVVVSSSYSAPNTTVVIAVNTAYVIANAAISAAYYSFSTVPLGMPATIVGFVGARAYLSATLGTTISGADTKVNLDTETYDVGGNFNTGTYRFVAPVSGYYEVSAKCGFTNSGTGKHYACSIYVNGAAICQSGVQSSEVSWLVAHIHDIIHLAATDYVELYYYHNDATTTDLNGGNNSSTTSMAIRLISAI